MKKILVILSMYSINAFATPKHVIIIRHAEKPEDGNVLSTEGVKRANALVEYVKTSPDMTKLGTPQFIFAASPKKESGSIRSIQTVLPLSLALNVKINTDYTRDDYKAMVREILKNPIYNNKTVFIAWAHARIAKMAKEFGAKDAPDDWHDNDYEHAWIISYKNNSIDFENVRQDIDLD